MMPRAHRTLACIRPWRGWRWLISAGLVVTLALSSPARGAQEGGDEKEAPPGTVLSAAEKPARSEASSSTGRGDDALSPLVRDKSSASRERAKRGGEAAKPSGRPESPASTTGEGTALSRYCASIADPAADARHRHQRKELEELRSEIRSRIAKLERRIAEYKEWLSRRDQFVDKVRESLVGIYASMKTEAAAKQLTEIDEETASAVLAKLDARNSSAIMAEMEPKKAARLVQLIASVGTISDESDAAGEPSGIDGAEEELAEEAAARSAVPKADEATLDEEQKPKP